MKARGQTVVAIPGGPWVPRVGACAIAATLFGLLATNPPTSLVAFLVFVIAGSIAALVMIALLAAAWEAHDKPRRSGLRLVAPGLWQGGLGNEAFDFDEYDLDVVVDLRVDAERPDKEPKVPTGKLYVRWPIIDRSVPDPDDLEVIAGFIASATPTSKVGVFCNMGMNRSGLVVALAAKAIYGQVARAVEETAERVFNEDFIGHLERAQANEDREQRVALTDRTIMRNASVLERNAGAIAAASEHKSRIDERLRQHQTASS